MSGEVVARRMTMPVRHWSGDREERYRRMMEEEHPVCTKLTSEENDIVKRMTDKVHAGRLVVVVQGQYSICGNVLRSLKDMTRMPHVAAIEAYIELLNDREMWLSTQAGGGMQRGTSPNAFCFGTTFYEKLKDGDILSDGIVYGNVKCMTRRGGVMSRRGHPAEKLKPAILEKDIVLIPIHRGYGRWCIIVVNFITMSITHLDSLQGKVNEVFVESVRKWLLMEVRECGGNDAADVLKIEDWPVEHNRHVKLRETSMPSAYGWLEGIKVPCQRKIIQSGIYMCMYADCIMEGVEMYFREKDLPILRKRMMLSLVRGHVSSFNVV